MPAVVRGQLPPPSAGQEGGGVQNDGIVSGGNSINQAPPTPPPRPPHGRSMSVDVKSGGYIIDYIIVFNNLLLILY